MFTRNSVGGSTRIVLVLVASVFTAPSFQGPAVGEIFSRDTSLSGLLDVYLPPLGDRMEPSLTAQVDAVNDAAEMLAGENRQRLLAQGGLVPEATGFAFDSPSGVGIGAMQLTQAVTPMLLPDMGEMRFAGIKPMVGVAVGGWTEPLYRRK